MKPALLFMDDGLAYLGRSFEAASSQHHAMLVCVALEGTYAFWCDGVAIEACRGVLLGPDIAHRYDGRGALVLTFFLDPESRRGRRLREQLGAATARPIDVAVVDAFARAMAAVSGDTERTALLDALLSALSGERERPLDPRIARALTRFRDEVPPLAALAELTGLSESRFRHLFADATGISYKRYALQRRIQQAARHLSEGRSVASAAHAAGFADEAHLSRTFRATFGVRVSDAFGLR